MSKKQALLLDVPREPKTYKIAEVKLWTLRETAVDNPLVDTPEAAAAFWREHVTPEDCQWFDADRECFVVLLLNTRRRIKSFYCVSIGTLDTILVSAGAVFRVAIVQASAAIILMHNHPGGDPSPSEGDIKVTRDLVRAGQLLKIEVLDHVIIGDQTPERRGWSSLRELGYFNF